MTEIQSLQDSWEKCGADYLEDSPEDEAREEHLKDWAGDKSQELWQHIAKELCLDFDISEIEEALIEADGSVEKAIEVLRQSAKEDLIGFGFFGEALTVAERNPDLVGVN